MRATLLILLAILLGGVFWLLVGTEREDGPKEDSRGGAEVGVATLADAEAATDEGELRRSTLEPASGGASTSAATPIRAGIRLLVTSVSGEPMPDALVRAALVEKEWPGHQPECDWSSPALKLLGESRSDAHGRAELPTLPECTRVLVAVEATAHTRAQQFVMTPEAKHSLDLGVWTLEPAPPVTLRFVDRNGAPAAELDFTLWSSEAGSGRRDDAIEGRTDSHGVAVVECFPMVAANVTVLRFGRYVFDAVEDVLAPGQREALVTVDSGEHASGRLLEDDGDPVAGARILLVPSLLDFEMPEGDLFAPWQWSDGDSYDDSRGFSDYALTDADGAFRVAGIPRDGAAIVFLARVEPGQWFAGRWTKQREGIELRVPVRHFLRGLLRGPFDPSEAIIHLDRKFTLSGDSKQREESLRYELEDLRLPLPPDGRLELLLPQATYRIGLEYPGGYGEIESELALTQPTDLGVRELGGGGTLVVRWPDAPAETDAAPRLQRAANGGVDTSWEAPSRARALRINRHEWKFLGLEPGHYRASLDGTRIEPIAGQVTLTTTEQAVLTLAPRATGTVIVELLGEDPAAFEGRTITLMAQPGADDHREALLVELDAQYPESKHLVAIDGRARALDLPAGRYLASLDSPEGVDESWSNDGEPLGELQLEAGGRAVLAADVGRFGTVRFVVLEAGQPVVGAGIAYSLLDDGGVLQGDVDPWQPPGTTTNDGSWTATGVAPGRYLAVVHLEDGGTRNEHEFVVSGGNHQVTIGLAQGVVRGRVLDASGAGAAAEVQLCAEAMWIREEGVGARVEEAALDDTLRKMTVAFCTTDSQGSYQFSHVPPGRYRLHAQSEDDGVAVGPWFEVQELGESTLEALTLLPRLRCNWTLRGLDAWQDMPLELQFRSATSGEVWRTDYFSNRRRTLAEETLLLRLPAGDWKVEAVARFDHDLGVIENLTIQESGTLPDFVLPPPSRYGVEPH